MIYKWNDEKDEEFFPLLIQDSMTVLMKLVRRAINQCSTKAYIV